MVEKMYDSEDLHVKEGNDNEEEDEAVEAGGKRRRMKWSGGGLVDECSVMRSGDK